MLSALLLKYARSLTREAVVECAMIFCFAYLAYISAEIFGLSGIIALLTSGIGMAQYTWFSLST
jgi:NhaP-type Na+/H+ or K+/H+ antiporter